MISDAFRERSRSKAGNDKNELELEANVVSWEGLWEELGFMKFHITCNTRTLQEEHYVHTRALWPNVPLLLQTPLHLGRSEYVYGLPYQHVLGCNPFFFLISLFLVVKHLVNTIFQLTLITTLQAARNLGGSQEVTRLVWVTQTWIPAWNPIGPSSTHWVQIFLWMVLKRRS